MRILSIADRVEPKLYKHYDRSTFPDVDLILSCGDLPPEYLTFLSSVSNVPLFYVRGNHDIRYESTPPEGCVNLHNQIIEHKGVKFLGLEGSRWYNGGPIQFRDREMRWIIRKLELKIWWQKGIDIVVTHAPIRNVQDADDQCHRGFPCFRPFVRRHEPRYFIHGHIHTLFRDPAERISHFHATEVVNAYGYHIIEFDPDANGSSAQRLPTEVGSEGSAENLGPKIP